jgi:hypothetical protein
MKKILSIDGGGIRGIIPAIVLGEIERQTGTPIAKLFDMVAGTSTGGLIALGLCVDAGDGTPRYSPADMLELYTQHGQTIFQQSFWRSVRTVSGLINEKYPHEPLEELLVQYLGDIPLGAALTKVLISSYNIEQRSPFFFKSWRDESSGVPMRQVARSTTAAPTFFEPAAPVPINLDNPPDPPPGSTLQRGEFALVDGAVFINNPAVSAYAEARRVFPDEAHFLVVSLGTGEATEPILYKDARDWGQAEWALPILGVVFDAVSDAVNYQMRQILNDETQRRFFRFQTRLSDAVDAIDDASQDNIAALQREAAQILQAQRAELQQVCTLLAQD